MKSNYNISQRYKNLLKLLVNQSLIIHFRLVVSPSDRTQVSVWFVVDWFILWIVNLSQLSSIPLIIYWRFFSNVPFGEFPNSDPRVLVELSLTMDVPLHTLFNLLLTKNPARMDVVEKVESQSDENFSQVGT